MEITVRKNITYNAALLYVDAGVRYWEDGMINGKEDTDCEETDAKPQMPCTVYVGPEDEYRAQQWRWRPIIDLESGIIINWKFGVTADIHYKVCDDFTMEIRDGKHLYIGRYDGYVPKIMSPADEGYGDYIIMHISPEGVISDWQSSEIKSVLEYLDEETPSAIPYTCTDASQYVWYLEGHSFDGDQVCYGVPECIANAQHSYDHLESAFADYTEEDRAAGKVPHNINIGKVEIFSIRAAVKGIARGIEDNLTEYIDEFASGTDCEGECTNGFRTENEREEFEGKVADALYPIITRNFSFYPKMRAVPFKSTYNLKERRWNDAPEAKEEPK